MESLISIAFVAVKIEIFKVLRTDSASMSLSGRFLALTPPVIWSSNATILTSGSTLTSIYRKGRTQSQQFSPEDSRNQKKISSSSEKQPFGYSIMSKSSLYWENTITFCNIAIFGLFLPGNRTGSKGLN